MGERQVDQGALFYKFSLDRHVPADHMLRAIDRFVDLEAVRSHLVPFYSSTGRPPDADLQSCASHAFASASMPEFICRGTAVTLPARLLQLAILAATAVDASGDDATVAGRLAFDTSAGAGEGAAPRLGNLIPAVDALGRPFADRKARPRSAHAVGYSVLNLVEDAPFRGPPGGHGCSYLRGGSLKR